MDTCGKLHKTCQARNLDIRVMGIPKTTDNDIAVTDHSPGFGSAARYIAACTEELCADVRSLPIHVVVMRLPVEMQAGLRQPVRWPGRKDTDRI